jgi:hypothetical protein
MSAPTDLPDRRTAYEQGTRIPPASFASQPRPKPWETVKEAILGPCNNPECYCHTGPHND